MPDETKRARFLVQGRRAAADIARWPSWMRDTVSPRQAVIRQLVPKPDWEVPPVPADAPSYSTPEEEES